MADTEMTNPMKENPEGTVEHVATQDDKPPEFHEEDVAGAWTVKIPILPCWDENDDGVPPPCRGPAPVACWKVFNPNNRYTNDNLVMIMLGNVGFSYFDKNRKYWMGAAMWSTLISIAFTVAGCFALSSNVSIVKNTNWVYVNTKNQDTGEIFISYLGLRSLVYESQPCDPLGCKDTSFDFVSTSTKAWPNEFIDTGLLDCRAITFGTAFGAFTTCATLIFALIGTMNRMRFSSDANIQKALGMITDLCGFISLLSTLVNVGTVCYGSIPRDFKASDGTTYHSSVWMGPGYWCYLVCLFGAFMRALFHWLTPLPNRGSGCTPRLPSSLVKQLDIDGDGKVTWEEMKIGYRRMVQKRIEGAKSVAGKAKQAAAKAAARGKSNSKSHHQIEAASTSPLSADGDGGGGAQDPEVGAAVSTQPGGAEPPHPSE